MANFYETLLTVLKADERFTAKDGAFLRNAVCEAAMKMDAKLLRLLLSNDETRGRFFTEADGVLVFDKIGFAWVVNNRQFLPDSYTRFKNKIGLADENGDLISGSGTVELVFPYKDCVLEGGQTKEEQKRGEIFYNETLAPDEVDRLLYPKVFANAKRYSYGGDFDSLGQPVGGGAVKCEKVAKLADTDNLIVKGNNLLALASLRKRYEGKVKCIYIDPPYNTGSDGFGYNDKFSRSTWLVFMKNRLEIARKLLSRDGVILIQCSFHQFPYLRVMVDEMFSEKNHLFDMNTLVRHPNRNLTGDKDFNDVMEYTLIYAKSSEYKMPKKAMPKTYDDYQYDIDLSETADETLLLGGKCVHVYYPEHVSIHRMTGHPDGLKSMSIRGSIREKNSSGRFYVSYLEKLIPKYPVGTIFAVPEMGDDGRKYRLFELPKNGNKNGFYYQGMPLSSDTTYLPYPNFVDFVQQYNNVNDEGGYSFRNGKKPEEYIQYYLNIFTKQGDWVLDFNLGSGTTAAVAHKMQRHYIGIEQMNYIDTITCERLKSVICGEDTGISKDVNWHGGGSFVYCELAKLNQSVVEEIEAAEDDAALSDIYDRMIKSGFISCKVKPSDIDAAAGDYAALSSADKKRFLTELLDKNLLYINYCDIDDEEFGVSEEDKAFTRGFYGEE